MGELLLSTGKTVSIDTSKISWGEWRKFFNGAQSQEEDDAFVEKCTGLSTSEQENMLRDDFRRLVKEIIKVGNEPLADPN